MSFDQQLSIQDIERMLARGRELRSAHLRRYLLAPVDRLLRRVVNRKRPGVAAILNHADPDRRSDHPSRARAWARAGIAGNSTESGLDLTKPTQPESIKS
jgi:hypothetical protein